MANHESVRRTKSPIGRNVPELKGGKEDSESKHGKAVKETSTSFSVLKRRGGGAFLVDVIVTAKQTAERTGLKKHPEVHSQLIVRQHETSLSETSGLSSREGNKFSRRQGCL